MRGAEAIVLQPRQDVRKSDSNSELNELQPKRQRSPNRDVQDGEVRDDELQYKEQ